MSVSSEVRRTLVKSPPELWAELSDPVTLARHLGELGEIRIVRTEPDRAVDWEAAAADGARASGRVEIEPSGWGTRVTLSASRTIVEPAARPAAEAAPIEAMVEPAAEPAAETEPEPAAETEPEPAAETEPIEAMIEPEPAAETEPIEAMIEPEPAAEAEPIEAMFEPEAEPEIVDPAPRPGFFARLFRRHRAPEPEPAVEPEWAVALGPAVEPEPAVKPEPAVEPEPEPIAEIEITEPAPEEAAPQPDISAELVELEEQTTAVLTGVLDRLGAAHHRPFSRA